MAFVLERYVDMAKSIYQRVAQLTLDNDAHRLFRYNMKLALRQAGDALARGDISEAARMLQIAGAKDSVEYGENAVENELRAWEGLPPEHVTPA